MLGNYGFGNKFERHFWKKYDESDVLINEDLFYLEYNRFVYLD